MAGAASTDITPVPNLSSGARSLTGQKKMKGFRTRLKARTICIRDESGTSIALVQLDLMFGSLLLHHQIAEKIAQETDIPFSNIVLTCTHTHSGPSHYCSNDFFNAYAGAKPGFDPTLYQFLTDQIVESILTAYQNMRPAKIATGSTDLYGFTRNRAIEAYSKNKGNENIDLENPDLILAAINPTMYMIRVDVLEEKNVYKPLGAFTTFSIHGTGVGDKVDIFNGDIFAYAQRDLEWNIQDHYETIWKPVHAFCNGTEGDIAPNLPYYKKNQKETKRVPIDFPAAKKIGQEIGQKAWVLFQELGEDLKTSIDIKVAAKEINIAENNKIDDVCICEKANVGVAALGGAYENRSPLHPIIGEHSIMGRKKRVDSTRCQGNKRLAIPRILEKKIPDAYPTNVMFQLIQIDDFLLVPLPWEVTTTAGERMTEKIKKAYEESRIEIPKHIVISSTANDYMGYATTPEEFSLQNYEGGQTIYGKNTVPYIALHLHHLTQELLEKDYVSEFPKEWKKSLLTKHYWAIEKEATEIRTTISTPKFVKAKPKNPKTESYWFIYWKDVFPFHFKMHEPIITVEKRQNQADWEELKIALQPIDDEGYEIEVRLLKEKKNYAEYMAKWYNPEQQQNAWYRFKIEPRNPTQKVLYSEPFQQE